METEAQAMSVYVILHGPRDGWGASMLSVHATREGARQAVRAWIGRRGANVEKALAKYDSTLDGYSDEENTLDIVEKEVLP